MRKLTLVALFALSACVGQKPDATDDFGELAGVDEKSDQFSAHLKLLGSLDYGQSATAQYTSTPTYRAYKFGGAKGDKVEIDVSSPTGDSVAWLLDNSYKIVAKNDDASSQTLDSHISATLPGNKNPDIITYLIVFRDYNNAKATFTVSLKGPAKDFYACGVDSDCVAVAKGGCCPNGIKVAVNQSSVQAYADSVACMQNPHPICPLALILDQRVAQCNTGTSKCEMIAQADIRCGGFTRNPHQCGSGYHCDFAGVVPDVPGHCKADVCVQNQACVQGSHWDTTTCSCVPTVTDCRTTGCAAGKYCTFCWANYACIPNGALC